MNPTGTGIESKNKKENQLKLQNALKRTKDQSVSNSNINRA